MKVATKTGDKGFTGLLSGERLLKSSKIFDALGDLDELNVWIGGVKVILDEKSLYKPILENIQKKLINLMGELAYTKNDYIKKFPFVDEDSLKTIDKIVEELQSTPSLQQTDWVLYGKTEAGFRLDLCSKVCRRAERKIVGLDPAPRDVILKFINRTNDLFYLMAREAELKS